MAVSKSDGFTCLSCHRSYPLIDGIPAFVDSSSTKGAESYDSSAFDFLWQMENRHFWHVGRREIILGMLKRYIRNLAECRMLEIGCGNGSVLAYLEGRGVRIEGGDLFTEGLKLCRQRTSAPLYQVDVLGLPFREEYEIIGLFDVLEHIERDEEALSQVRKALKSGGYMLCTVPAGKRLWSGKDVSAHHQRRYEKAELTHKLEQSGFTVKRVSHFVFFFFPVIMLIRTMSRLLGNRKRVDTRASVEFKTIPVINGALLWLFRIERFLLRHWSLPFGASLVVLAQKEVRSSSGMRAGGNPGRSR